MDDGADHFHAPDLAVFNQKASVDQNARWPIEAFESVFAAVRKHALVYRALIEDRVRPDHAALVIY